MSRKNRRQRVAARTAPPAPPPSQPPGGGCVHDGRLKDCKDCGCAAIGPMALWREFDGTSVFTGLTVERVGETRKVMRLDDPAGPLDGPGHAASALELQMQLACYDGTKLTECRGAPLPGLREMCCEGCFERFGLVAHERNDGGIQGPFFDDGKYVTSVRFGDSIKVVLEGQFRDDSGQTQTATEQFWMDVLAVLPHNGLLVADTAVALRWLTMPTTAPYWVPISAVVGIKRKENWSHAPGGAWESDGMEE